MKDWTRKNAFVRRLREMLKGFRILAADIEHYDEVAPTDETLGRLHGVPRGRGVVIIKLKGTWRK
jgi:hypothetical protein